MLKFLTHKLRTHSINEDPNQEKSDDDHDSGTESDDEFQDGSDTNQPTTPMESPSSPAATDSALPSDTDFSAPIFAFIREPCKETSEDINGKAKKSSTVMATTTPTCHSRESKLLLFNYNNDQHSSEEELEVINSPKVVASQGCRPATAPEKRKWSQVSCGNGAQSHCSRTHKSLASSSSLLMLSQQQHQHQQQHQKQQGKLTAQQTHRLGGGVDIVGTCSAPVSRAGREAPGSGSSDEEVQGLLSCNNDSISVHCQPVKFHTSPPVDVHKPGRSLSPPPKLFHASTRDSRQPPRPRSRPRHHPHLYHHHHHQQQQQHHHHYHQYQIETDIDTLSACSPRKRHRPPHRQSRPCLDFEKMQQLKARALTTWRHSGEHGTELSVFCW